MRARPVKARTVGAAVALSVLLIAMSASEARAAPGWAWPVAGAVITPYSNDDANPYAGGVHRGIDIAAPVGTGVRAARAGVVTYAGALGYSGLTIAVRTVDGYVTSYLHLSAIGVRRGDSVGGGHRLGEVGTTGRRSKPEAHLHFGVRVAGAERRYVDPLSLLPPLPAPSAAPPPVPAPVPARAIPAPEPVRVAPAPRRALSVPRPEPEAGRVPVHLPLPVPVAHRSRVHRVPVAPAPKPLAHGRAAHTPEPVAPPRKQARAPDWGRPLALAGLGLLVLALFGRSAVRILRDANGTVSGQIYSGIVRGLRPIRASLPRSQKATISDP
jgi:hypothetical protein